MKNQNSKGMTFIELMIVVSLISVISLAIYNSLSNGLKVWNKSNRAVTEADVAIFFDKITHDLNNAHTYSGMRFEGYEYKFTFPSIIRTPVDRNSGLPENEYFDQLGKVEYYFELLDRGLYKRQANFSQAQEGMFGPPQLLVKNIDKLTFRYVYMTESEVVITADAFEIVPAGIEIEVEFEDADGKKAMQKVINIPIGI